MWGGGSAKRVPLAEDARIRPSALTANTTDTHTHAHRSPPNERRVPEKRATDRATDPALRQSSNEVCV